MLRILHPRVYLMLHNIQNKIKIHILKAQLQLSLSRNTADNERKFKQCYSVNAKAIGVIRRKNDIEKVAFLWGLVLK